MAPQKEIDVLHVIGSLAQGGAERNLYYLAPSMAKSRFRYGICCLVAKGELAREIERLGIPIWDMGYRRRHAILTILRLRRLLKERKVRVLHTHLYESGVVGRIAGWLAGVPVIVTHEHGKTVWKKWYHRWFERLAIHGTDLRIAVSEDIRRLRLRDEHTPASKIVVIGNAVEPARFEVNKVARDAKRREIGFEKSLLVGTVGRLVVAKSYDFLLQIAKEVCEKRPDVRFVLVGEGPLREELVEMRDSLGLTDKVVFLGARTDISELLAAMDLYVITSRREGLPVSLIEAMMAAKPIVSTSVGGIPEALSDNEDGILVEPRSVQSFAEAIVNLINDPEKMAALGQKAKGKAIARYSAHKVLETLEQAYTSILSRKGIDLSPS
jgi:glycosyltransferase involved in cell wall biosynthesis